MTHTIIDHSLPPLELDTDPATVKHIRDHLPGQRHRASTDGETARNENEKALRDELEQEGGPDRA